jgi:hypothetical protein
VFALVFAWKIALFVFTVQPVPANDAFFYDGAVIHHLLHGGYYNPCVALAFPVSGTQVFSAYPPGYQLPLLAWMSVFGVSAFSAMALHITLFGLYLLVLLAIFRRLQTPAWCVNTAGVFLLLFTFHDRPDSFAHLLGMLGLYACVRSRRIFGRSTESKAGIWTWLMAVFIVLAICSSLQIGTTYLGVVFACTIAACHFDGEKLPLAPLVAMVLVPIALVLFVKFELPNAWAGFMENVRQTPFLTGLRWPAFGEFLKIFRTVPAILLITVLLPISWMKQHYDFESSAGRREEIILLAALLPALGILAACLTLISPNTVGIANYLQPLIVASYLALTASLRTGENWLRLQVVCLVPAMLLGSVRAVGMTTWGVACAMDFSYADSVKRVEAELINHPPGYKVVMSSAFLYGVAHHDDLTFIHSDWMAPSHGDSRISDVRALTALKPEKIILTQFDYYRRYQTVLELAKTNSSLQDVQVINAAHTRAPDSYKSLQQVVQNISRAPVIVNLSWRN